MKDRISYRVVVEREPGWWIITVPDLPGAHSQARRLSEVEHNAAEAIAVVLDVEPVSFDLRVEVKPPEEVKRQLEEATETQKRAAGMARGAIHRLTHDLGLTLRDAGEVAGLSYQRVAQLGGPKRKAS